MGHFLPVFPGVTTVLSMTTLTIGSRTSLPNTNCFIKAIDVYLGICFSFVFGALLEYAVVHYSSLQQMAAEDRVRILRTLHSITCAKCWSTERGWAGPSSPVIHSVPSETHPCAGVHIWKSQGPFKMPFFPPYSMRYQYI
jgi:hypothetical protein